MTTEPHPHWKPLHSRWNAFTDEEKSAIHDGLIWEYEARKDDPGNPELERLADVAGEMLHELNPAGWW